MSLEPGTSESPAVRLSQVLARRAALGPALLAVSGGLDSRVLAHACLKAREAGLDNFQIQAVHIEGPHVPAFEAAGHLEALEQAGMIVHRLACDPLALPGVAANTRERCYECKKALFEAVWNLARELGCTQVFEGSQADDTAVFRPGRRALAELEVASPLAEAGLSKAEVRELARELGLGDPEQPARSCLLARLDYGVRPSHDLLVRLGRAEAALSALGLREFRVRLVRPENGEPRVLLHLGPAEGDLLESDPGLRGRVMELLTAEGLAPDHIRVDERISGYFDTASKPD